MAGLDYIFSLLRFDKPLFKLYNKRVERGNRTTRKKEIKMIRVTYYVWSKSLNKGFTNIETHKSIEDARLRGYALGWSIVKVETIVKV
jgi:hypothetical protein